VNGSYIGGYYGACNEKAMMKELQNGPFVVAFEATGDFFHYQSGIYTGSETKVSMANRWEPTNHAVVAVGYGTDPASNTKYWKIKNSWGAAWGEKGYFRIVRGVDANAIESMASSAVPVLLNQEQQQARQQCSSAKTSLLDVDSWEERADMSESSFNGSESNRANKKDSSTPVIDQQQLGKSPASAFEEVKRRALSRKDSDLQNALNEVKKQVISKKKGKSSRAGTPDHSIEIENLRKELEAEKEAKERAIAENTY